MDTLTHALSGALIARATAGRGNMPFRYGMCRENAESWRSHRLVADTERIPLGPE